MSPRPGRHFLQIPGPTNVPDRVLRAMAAPTIDHRGPEFAVLAREVLAGLAELAGTTRPVALYASSGTGAAEAALVNTLSSGDAILAFDTGQFAAQWAATARRLGLDVDLIPGDWRHGVPTGRLAALLDADTQRRIKAVTVVHNETSTGAVSPIPPIRAAIDAANHPALLLVDTVSSLGSVPYRHDDWGVDVTVWGSQKGMMLPPGLGLNAVSDKALAASRTARLPRSYWDWEPMLDAPRTGFFPYTPPTNLMFGLREALTMLAEEGHENVFERHRRHAEATRAAVRGWGLEFVCQDPAAYSDTVTSVLLPDGHDADALRALILDRYNLSLGAGLGRLAGRAFRIGHLGNLGDLELAGTLCGVEMGLASAGVPAKRAGVAAALDCLASRDADGRGPKAADDGQEMTGAARLDAGSQAVAGAGRLAEYRGAPVTGAWHRRRTARSRSVRAAQRGYVPLGCELVQLH